MKALFIITLFTSIFAYSITRPEAGLNDQIWQVHCSNGVFEYLSPSRASNQFEVELCEIFAESDPLDI